MIIGVVVTHASPSTQLARCLGALLDDGGLDRLLVVDNGGSAQVPDRDDVEVIRTENRGFGAAANDGVQRAGELGADMIALLNDDVVVRPGWLDLGRGCARVRRPCRRGATQTPVRRPRTTDDQQSRRRDRRVRRRARHRLRRT
ncbi:MAG: glycosyltransferase [Ilumatobacteraceae bacterium]